VFYFGTLLTDLQNPEEDYPTLISDLTAICLQSFQMADPDEHLTLLVYYENYFPILQIKFPYLNRPPISLLHLQIHTLLETIIASHRWLESTLTSQHYTRVAKFFL